MSTNTTQQGIGLRINTERLMTSCAFRPEDVHRDLVPPKSSFDVRLELVKAEARKKGNGQ